MAKLYFYYSAMNAGKSTILRSHLITIERGDGYHTLLHLRLITASRKVKSILALVLIQTPLHLKMISIYLVISVRKKHLIRNYNVCWLMKRSFLD